MYQGWPYFEQYFFRSTFGLTDQIHFNWRLFYIKLMNKKGHKRSLKLLFSVQTFQPIFNQCKSITLYILISTLSVTKYIYTINIYPSMFWVVSMTKNSIVELNFVISYNTYYTIHIYIYNTYILQQMMMTILRVPQDKTGPYY